MITGLKHRFERIRSRSRRLGLLAAANDYMGKTPGLKDILAYANVASPSVGVSTTDYVALYRKIRTDRPSFVLECGTGRSTMIIAQAMLENLNGTPADGIKLVSMEHNPIWYEHALSALPDQFKPFVEIRQSPIEVYSYSFVRGHVYKEVPDYPYQFVFVDGPPQGVDGKAVMCDMDFVRVVAGSETPVSAFVDNRKHSVLAYSLIFGPNKVSYHSDLGLGVVKEVTCQDMVLGDKDRMKMMIFQNDIVRKVHGSPV